MKMPDSIEVLGGPITLVFSKSGRAFFSERITGNIWEIIEFEKYKIIKHFPVVQVSGHHESGILGIALDPDFENNGYIYAYFTEGKDINQANNKVVRFVINTDKEETLISGIPAERIHNGGIIAFGPDGKLYIGTGIDNPIKHKSQDKNNLGGKILRINSDGSIPDDNPFKGSPVYSLGHRNIFGLAFNPNNRKLYVSDVGEATDDEVNIIQPGGNYGWPEARGFNNNPKFIEPIATYTPTITPTQNVFYNNDLYFGSYNNGNIHKLTLSSDGSKVISDVIVYQGKPFGITGVFVSPDQEFFVTTTNRIMKVKLNGGGQKMKKKSIIWIIVILIVLGLGIGLYFVYNNKYMPMNNNTNNAQNNTAGTVTIHNLAFSPTTITINKGDTVTWQNNDSIVHHIVADDNSFDLGDMVGGGKSTYTFNTVGTFNYHCSIHTYMTGVVIVK